MTVSVTLDRPWLTIDLGARHRAVSWALNRSGFVETDQILWREVRNADLPRDLDVKCWLEDALRAKGATHAVALLTSRDVRAYKDETVTVEGVSARCIATVGLSNAESVGARVDRSQKDWGTINIAVIIDAAITDAARLEALTIAAQARTAAILDCNLALPTGPATGTGTDCIAISAPEGDMAYAGLHTALGEAVGGAVHRAVASGAREWMDTVRREDEE
jgi:adenosylcobinamide amidohydrolase